MIKQTMIIDASSIEEQLMNQEKAIEGLDKYVQN